MRTEPCIVFNGTSGVDKTTDPVRMSNATKTIHALLTGMNIDIDKTGATSRKASPNRVVAGTFHSMKGFEDICLVVEGTTLSRFNTNLTRTALKTGIGSRMTYCKINHEIYCSDSLLIGYVADGRYNDLPSVTEGITNDELFSWITKTRMSTPAGQLLAHYDQRMLVARGNEILITDPLAYHRVHKRLGSIPMSGYVTLLYAVNDGFWVSDGKLWFFKGSFNDEEGRPASPLPTEIAQYSAHIDAVDEIPQEALGYKEVRGKYFMFSTNKGICIAGDGGFFRNLTEDKYPDFDAKRGTALYRQYKKTIFGQTKTIDQFLVCCQN